MDKRIQAQELRTAAYTLLRAAGLSDEDAATAADVLIDADLRGIATHGSFRLPVYLDRLAARVVNHRPVFRLLEEYPATALLDGDDALGQVSGVYAMKLAIEKARSTGVGFVGVVHGHHYGAGSYFANMAAQADMIGLALCNTKPLISPPGARVALVGNNPVAIGIPAGKNPPFLLDIALSQVSHGRIRIARLNGQQLSPGWALDSLGNPTTDPALAEDGTLLPAGGHKGYGLALAVDIVSGMLCGAGWASGVRSLNNYQEKQNSGQLYAAMNIAAFRDVVAFKDEMDEYIAQIKACPRQPGVDEILYPGAGSARRYDENLRLGIPVHEKTLALLRTHARRLGVTIAV